MTEPSEPTSFFAPPPSDEDHTRPAEHEMDGAEEHGEEISESHPFDADLPVHVPAPPGSTPFADVDPLTAPPGTFETWDATPLAPSGFSPATAFPAPVESPQPWTAPADDSWLPPRIETPPLAPSEPAATPSAAAHTDEPEPVAQQQQLAQLLADLRAAVAAAPAGDDAAGAVAELRAELAAARGVQAAQHAELSARLERLAAAVEAAAAGSEQAAAPAIDRYDEITLQDVHDGLAGVRTDISALPDQLGPGVTSAVAHGMAETGAQVAAVATSLEVTAAEAAGLRAQLAEVASHVALLPAAVEGLHELTARLSALEAAGAGLDLDSVVDRQLTEHLTAFSAGVGERLDALAAEMVAVSEEQAGSRQALAELATRAGLEALGERWSVGLAESRVDLSGVATGEGLAALGDRLAAELADGRVGLSGVATGEGLAALGDRLAAELADGRVDLSGVATGEGLVALGDRLAAELADGRVDLSGVATGEGLVALGDRLAAELADGRVDLSGVATGEGLAALGDRLAAELADGRVDLSGVATGEGLAALGDRLAAELADGRVDLSGLATREDLVPLHVAEGPAPALVAVVEATERRLARHVDEAVLALAQAVLRRRPPPTTPAAESRDEPWSPPQPPELDTPDPAVPPSWTGEPAVDLATPAVQESEPVAAQEFPAQDGAGRVAAEDGTAGPAEVMPEPDVAARIQEWTEHGGPEVSTVAADFVGAPEPTEYLGDPGTDQSEGAVPAASGHDSLVPDATVDDGAGEAVEDVNAEPDAVDAGVIDGPLPAMVNAVSDPGEHAQPPADASAAVMLAGESEGSDLIDDDPVDDDPVEQSEQVAAAYSPPLLDEHHEVWAKGDPIPSTYDPADGPERPQAPPPAWTGLDAPPDSETPHPTPDVLPVPGDTPPAKRGLFRRKG